MDSASEFIGALPMDAKHKIWYNMQRAQETKDASIFKKLTGTDIWEFRTLHKGTAYRLFAFWDKYARAYVVVTHGIEKKTQKTPRKEIIKAENIKKQYYKEVYNEND